MEVYEFKRISRPRVSFKRNLCNSQSNLRMGSALCAAAPPLSSRCKPQWEFPLQSCRPLRCCSFDRDGLCQISWLIHIGALEIRNEIREQLQGNNGDEWQYGLGHVGHAQN